MKNAKHNLFQFLFQCTINSFINEWLRERTEHLNIISFFFPSLGGVLFLMFCLLVEVEC